MSDGANIVDRVFLFTREGIRSLDAAATKEFGLPGIVMMENAASALLTECLGMTEAGDDRSVYICCGPGNNGGDGLALARRLHNERIPVLVLLLEPRARITGDAAINLSVVERMGISIISLDREAPERTFDAVRRDFGPPSLIVDALFGTGLDRDLIAPATDVVEWINRLGAEAPVLAVDIPSGLDCDTGQPLGDAVRAAVTLTLAGPKVGFDADEAEEYLGEIAIGDIGAPVELLERFAEEILVASDD